MLQKVIVFLFGLASIAIGIRSIAKKEARFSWSASDEEQRVVEGFPAIIVGLFEVCVGIYILMYGSTPF